MSRVVNYYNLGQGETYDLLLLEFNDGFPNSSLSFLISDTPRKVTGVQKVIQTFLYFLMTRKGTDLLDPNKGTYFTDYTMYSNTTGSTLAVHSAVETAINDASSQAKASLASVETDPTCLLDSVDIAYVDVATGSSNVYLTFITQAGENASVSVPFPQENLVINASTTSF